jgi:hypothetical protein
MGRTCFITWARRTWSHAQDMLHNMSITGDYHVVWHCWITSQKSTALPTSRSNSCSYLNYRTTCYHLVKTFCLNIHYLKDIWTYGRSNIRLETAKQGASWSVFLIRYFSHDQTMDEIGMASTMHGEKEKWIKNFGAETSWKEGTWKTHAEKTG